MYVFTWPSKWKLVAQDFICTGATMEKSDLCFRGTKLGHTS